LRDLPLELNAVGTLWGHGFHPLKAQLTTVQPKAVMFPTDAKLLKRFAGSSRILATETVRV